MFKPDESLIEQLIRHNQRTGFTHGDKPQFKTREKPLLHHFSSSFLSETRTDRRALVGSLAVLVENVSGSQPGSRTEPDQHSSTISLWIAHYRPRSVMKPRAMTSKC